MSISITPCCSWFTNNGLPRRKDGPWAFLVLAYYFTNGMFIGGLSFGYGVILPILMESFNTNREKAALAGSLAMGTATFLCVFSSKICERYTCRIANGVGLVIISAAFALSSLPKSIYTFYFTYSLLLGIGGSLTYSSMFITLNQYFKKRYSLAMGIGTAGAGLGTLLIGPVMQSMTSSLGWQNTFRILSGVFCFLLLFDFIVDPNVEEEYQEETERIPKNPMQVDASKPRKIVLGFFDLSVWRFPEYTLCVVAISVGSFGHYTAMIHMVKYAEELSISPTKGSTLFVFFGSATITSRLISGRLCDISFIEARYVQQAGLMLSGISTIMLSFAQTYTHLIVFAIVYGLADGAIRVTVNILFLNTVDMPRRPSAFGQANMVASFSVSAGPPIAGLMADKMGSYKGAFYMAGAISILGSVILFAHYLYCCKKSINDQHIIISDSEDQNHNSTGVVDHQLACVGPAGLSEDDSQTLTKL